MKNLFVLVFCLNFVFARIREKNSKENVSELMKIIEDIVIKSKSPEGIVVIDIQTNDQATDKAMDKICEGILRNLPSFLITPNRTDILKNVAGKKNNPLIVYAMDGGKNETELKRVVNVVSRLHRDGRRKSKTIIINLFDKKRDDKRIERMLEYAWLKKLKDFTVMDVSNTSGIRFLTHDPFKKNHQNTPKKLSKYFQNELIDLQGYQINVLVAVCNFFFGNTVPQACTRDIFHQPHSEYMKLMALADGMNTTFNITYIDETSLKQHRRGGSPKRMKQLHSFMISNNVHFALIPIKLGECLKPECELEPSPTYLMTKVCAVVPILYSTDSNDTIIRLLIVIIMTFGLVLSFWMISKLFRYDARTWGMLNLFRGLLGVSWSQELKVLTERIMYVTMIIGFTRFTFHLYSELVDLTTNLYEPVKLDTFEDMQTFGLKPALTRLSRLMFVNLTTGNLREWLSDACIIDKPSDCFEELIKFQNLTCIVTDLGTNLWKTLQTSNMDGKLKITNACLAHSPIVFYIDPCSPFLDRINIIISRLEAGGFFKKWMMDHAISLKSSNRSYDPDIDKDDASPETLIVKSLLWIYVVPLFTFFIELIVYQIRKIWQARG